MKMLTFKLKPKTLFGIILAVTGVVVILITFAANHTPKAEKVSATISASTDAQRQEYLSGFGWQVAKDFQSKELTIPEAWNDVYIQYNEIQKNQGFDLTDYKGKTVTIYTYTITNYEEGTQGIVADMLVCDGILIGGDVCNTSAKNGFLVGFSGNNGTS